MLVIMVMAGCTEPDDLITSNAQEAALVSLSGSGSLAGAPEPGKSLDSASITFQQTELEYNLMVASGLEDVSQITTYKVFAGQTVEIQTVSATEEGVTIEFSSIQEFLEGFSGVAESDLRVGDQVLFYSELIMKDGRVIRDRNADLGVNISCLADLTGTYVVTNDFCPNDPDLPFTVTITRNPDGSYHLTSADGGWLSKCTSNTSLANAGNIVEQCGEILPSTDLDYGSANSTYNIGEIQGGTWDAANGILTMDHTEGYFTGGPYSWTSTYTRQ